MRIIFLTTKLDFIGGGGSTLDRHNKAAALLALGHEVKVITTSPGTNKFKSKPPYAVLEEEISYNNFFQFHRAVKDLLTKYENAADIFYVDGHIFSYGAGRYRQRPAGRPVVGHFDNYPPELYTPKSSGPAKIKLAGRRYFEKIFLQRAYNSLDLFSFPSPVIQDIYFKFGLAKNKAIIMPAFMDLSIFRPKEEGPSCQNEQGDWRALFIGRLIREKGLGVLLEAFKFLDKYEIGLDVVGSGADEEDLKKTSQRLGLGEKINWHPWVNQEALGTIYRRARVFVSPALWPEPFGMTTAEAMFCGTPVIASDKTGPAWIIRNGAGLIFRNNDAVDLAQKIEQLYENDELAEQLARRGRERLKDFDLTVLARTLDQKMRGLVNV